MGTSLKVKHAGEPVTYTAHKIISVDSVLDWSNQEWRDFALSLYTYGMDGVCLSGDVNLLSYADSYQSLLNGKQFYPVDETGLGLQKNMNALGTVLYTNLYCRNWPKVKSFVQCVYGVPFENFSAWLPRTHDASVLPNWIYHFGTPPEFEILEGQPIVELEFKRSVDTPGFWDRKTVPITRFLKPRPMKYQKPRRPVFFPLKRKMPKEPVKPVLKSIDHLKEPTFKHDPANSKLTAWKTAQWARVRRLNDLRMEKYRKKLSVYETLKEKYYSRISEHRETFQKRLAKYYGRLERWEQLSGVRSVTRLKTVKTRRKQLIPVWNPYLYVKWVPKTPKPYVDWNRVTWAGDFSSSSGRSIGSDCHPTGVDFDVGSHSREFTWQRGNPATYEDSGDSNLGVIGFAQAELRSMLIPRFEASSSRLLEKMSNQKVHFGTMLAEAGQTTALLIRAVVALVQFCTLKRHLFSTAYKTATSASKLSSEFLAFQFGVLPLYKDVNELAKMLMGEVQMLTEVRSRVRFHGSLEHGEYRWDGLFTLSHRLRFEIENSFVRTLQEFGLVNPAEVLWEVVPWSFVVDWFLPIGNWIQQASASAGTVDHVQLKKISFIGTVTAVSGGGDFEGSYHVVDREVLTGLPFTGEPNFKNPFSTLHSLEALALLLQRLK